MNKLTYNGKKLIRKKSVDTSCRSCYFYQHGSKHDCRVLRVNGYICLSDKGNFHFEEDTEDANNQPGTD